MAPELGMGMGMGFGIEAISSSSTTAATNSNAYLYGLPSTDTLRIDDLLDFSTQDAVFDPTADATHHHHHHHHHNFNHFLPQSDPYSTGNCGVLTENKASASNLAAFPDDLYIPSEEAAELEWLSKFVEDSFSDMPFPSPATNMALFGNNAAQAAGHSTSSHQPCAVPGRARSKRSRAPATSTNLAVSATWSTSHIHPSLSSSPSSSSSSSSETKQRASNFAGAKKEAMNATMAMPEGGNVRKCTHCSSEKTPQWRTGPLGPKTLCNACGVRYKSGRLVPEYRPAASPTFVLTQHSNSHRKVIELRRQKELLLRQHHAHRDPSTASTRPDLLLC